MGEVLKKIFHPGHSRHDDKNYDREGSLIRSIGTMRNMSADVHQFACFVRNSWPDVRTVSQVTPEMARAYIDELVRRECSGGRIGRVCASLRKLDSACKAAGIFPLDTPTLLPYPKEGDPGGFHSQPRPVPYPMDHAQKIVTFIEKDDPLVARLLRLMIASGLRIQEACYLRSQNIDLEYRTIRLSTEDNANRTKVGRPRPVTYPSEYQDFMGELKRIGDRSPTGHIFPDRRSLPNRARARVRNACQALNIPGLGSHGFRKTFAVKTMRPDSVKRKATRRRCWRLLVSSAITGRPSPARVISHPKRVS